MSTRSEETSRRRRSPMACEFCRQRKMKCNNERPECQNCNEHGRHCVYAELAKKPRPSTARIVQLEQENQQLRESLESLKDQIKRPNNASGAATTIKSSDALLEAATAQWGSLPCGAFSGPSQRAEVQQIPTPADTSHSSDTTIEPRVFYPDQDKDSGYHGPTSAAFDEKSAESRSRHDTDAAKVPDVWIKRQLVAESTNQRQLETVNLLAGNLDFDGVDPELGMHLLTIYWNRQHSTGPVVYRTAFMRDMACRGPYFSKLLLNAIYFYACKYTTRVEVRRDPNSRLTAGWMFRQKATELLDKSYDKSSITTIQALLLMSSALFSWCDEKSMSWLYSGMAFSMIVDLGIHVDATISKRKFVEEDLEIRLRVFWTAYVNDKVQSLYQGRPCHLREAAQERSIDFLDQYEELELFNPLSYTQLAKYPISPVYSLSTFTAYCKLSIILDRILQTLYSEESGSRSPKELLMESNLIHSELEKWRNSLPPHLDLILSDPANLNPLPFPLDILSMFNVLVILLHRPFVSDSRLNSTSSSIALEAFLKCCLAAFEVDRILRIYERSYSLTHTHHMVSYATYVSATIHVRLAAQREPGSCAHKALRKCIDILDLQQTACWSPRRAKRVIDDLISRLGIVFDDEDSPGSTPDLDLPNADIQAIVRSFTQKQPAAGAPIQQSFSGIESSNLASSPAFVSSINDYNGIIENEPFSADHSTFLYDPIFGFDGDAFDSMDFGFGTDFC